MEFVIIIFFLAIFLGVGFLALVIFLFRRRRSRGRINRFHNSPNPAIHQSRDTNYSHSAVDTDDFAPTNFSTDDEKEDESYRQTAPVSPVIYEPQTEKPQEAAGFAETPQEAAGYVPQTEASHDYSSSSGSSSDYSSYSDSSSSSDSGSSSSSSD